MFNLSYAHVIANVATVGVAVLPHTDEGPIEWVMRRDASTPSTRHIVKPARPAPPGLVLRELLQRVREVGGDAAAILRRAGITPGVLVRPDSSWLRHLTRDQFTAIYHDCSDVLEGHVARRAGRPAMNKAEVDLLCYCVITCATLQQAIDRAAAFCAMLGGRAGELSLQSAGERAEFRMHTFHEKRDVSAFLSDLTGLSTYARLFGWLIGQDLEPLTVRVCYRPLLDDAVTAWLLPHAITYGAPDNFLGFPARHLRQPVIRSATELDELLRVFPFDLTTEQSRSAPLSERVRTIFGTALAHRAALPTISRLASQFAISVATLKRRLTDEGTSIQALKDRCRHELALDLLRDPALSFGEVAARLGFSDATTFTRAFKVWAGRSPSAYRRALE